MTVSAVAPDYYAVLQVHPDADFEVIEAAYRQLMKKHHPDMAGDDPQRVAEHLRRSKALNEAFRVLRDPEQRRRYDLDRVVVGTVPPPSSASRPASASPPPPPPPPAPPPPPPQPPRPSQPPPDETSADLSAQLAPETPWYLAPFTLLSSAYYLLPGTYEWEPGSGRELLSVILLPPLTLFGFALASGRLSPLIGQSLTASMAAWALLALVAALAMWGTVLRVLIATVPTLLLVSGLLNPYLEHAHVPIVIAWGLLSSLSLILSARLYIFGVIPSLAVIWLVRSA